MQLSEKQKAVFRYLLHFRSLFTYMPTTRDIQDHFGYRSQTAACNHLNALEEKGYIKIHARKARAIQILKELPNEPQDNRIGRLGTQDSENEPASARL